MQCHFVTFSYRRVYIQFICIYNIFFSVGYLSWGSIKCKTSLKVLTHINSVMYNATDTYCFVCAYIN